MIKRTRLRHIRNRCKEGKHNSPKKDRGWLAARTKRQLKKRENHDRKNEKCIPTEKY